MRNRFWIMSSLALYLCYHSLPTMAQHIFPTQKITVGTMEITAEIANTDALRMQGLMHRTSLPKNQGMYFVFDTVDFHCMWMKNTYIPLSVAFIDQKNTVINIEHMRAHDLQSHCAKSPAKYALEMPLGWFEKNQITSGVTISQQ